MDFCSGNSPYGGTPANQSSNCIQESIPSYYEASYNTATQPVPDSHYFQNQTWQSVDSFVSKQTGGGEYTPLPTGALNGFSSDAGGPGDIGVLGAQQGAMTDWYYKMVYRQYDDQMSQLLVNLGYMKLENVPGGNPLPYTDWRDFFKDVGINYQGPGFPSTAPPASVSVHPNKCSALSQAVTQYENTGQIPPPALVQAMKKACGIP